MRTRLLLPLLLLLPILARAEVIKNDGPKPTLTPKPDGTLTLAAADCTIHGTKAKLEKKGTNPLNIGYWTSDADTVSWAVKLDKPGTYDVDLEYSLAANSKGSEISIEFGDAAKVPVALEAGKTFLDFKTTRIGQVTLKPGDLTVTLRPTKKPGVAVMDLRQITLTPAKP